MTEIRYTSAGRLLEEIYRIKRSYDKGNNVYHHLDHLFGGPGVPWSKGLGAFDRLVARVESDLEFVSDTRRQKFQSALAAVWKSVDAESFHLPAQGVAKSYLTDLNIERIESVDDLLVSAGRSLAVDQERAGAVSQTLSDLIDEIAAGESSEIDDFLNEKLSELQFILDHYALYGADGVKDAVSVLIGSITIESVARGGLSEAAKKHARGVWRVAKGALDALVYTQSGADAIEWAGHGLAGLLEG